jgi:hypothetical protein
LPKKDSFIIFSQLLIRAMIKSLFVSFIFIVFLLLSCSKNQSSIDVSQQWNVDYNGNLIQGPSDGVNDGQWGPKVFSVQEKNLFTGLDTANLSGTTAPDSVLSSSTIIPNPFKTEAIFVFSFSGGFNGQVEFKYVIVDDNMKTMDKGAIRIQATSNQGFPSNPSTSGPIPFFPNIPVGKFRIYYSLSAASSSSFYTSWGNIQKTQ